MYYFKIVIGNKIVNTTKLVNSKFVNSKFNAE